MKKNEMTRRILAVLLAFVLTLGLLPTSAFAARITTDEVQITNPEENDGESQASLSLTATRQPNVRIVFSDGKAMPSSGYAKGNKFTIDPLSNYNKVGQPSMYYSAASSYTFSHYSCRDGGGVGTAAVTKPGDNWNPSGTIYMDIYVKEDSTGKIPSGGSGSSGSGSSGNSSSGLGTGHHIDVKVYKVVLDSSMPLGYQTPSLVTTLSITCKDGTTHAGYNHYTPLKQFHPTKVGLSTTNWVGYRFASTYSGGRGSATFYDWVSGDVDATANVTGSGNFPCSKNFYLIYDLPSSAYTITYNANGGSGGPSSTQTEKNTDATKYATLSADKPTRSGYKFLGWSTDRYASTATYQPSAYQGFSSNTTLYAVWKENTVKIIYKPGVGGNGTDKSYDWSGASHTVKSSGAVGFTPKTGYRNPSLYWEDSDGNTYEAGDEIGVKPAEDLILTAVWQPYYSYLLFYNEGKVGSDTVEGLPSMQPSGMQTTTTYTFTLSDQEPTREGYRFLGWSTTTTGEPMYQPGGQVTVTNNTPGNTEIVNLYALWESITPTADYTVQWFDTLGNKLKADETRNGTVGETVSATYNDKYNGSGHGSIEGYDFVNTDSRNVTSDTLAASGTVLKLYFMPMVPGYGEMQDLGLRIHYSCQDNSHHGGGWQGNYGTADAFERSAVTVKDGKYHFELTVKKDYWETYALERFSRNYPNITHTIVTDTDLVVTFDWEDGAWTQTSENPDFIFEGNDITYIWKDASGNQIETVTQSACIDPPAFPGANLPQKPEDDDNTYDFDKWSDPKDEDGKVVYEPEYTATPKTAPELAITKTVDKAGIKVNNKEGLTYTITVSNTGNAAATNVVVTDTLPEELTYVLKSTDGTSDASATGNNLTWNLDSIAAGASVQFTFKAKTDRTGHIENYASVDCDEIDDPVTTDEPACTTIYNFSVTKSNNGFQANTPKKGMATVHYTVTVTNPETGGIPLYGLNIKDVLTPTIKVDNVAITADQASMELKNVVVTGATANLSGNDDVSVTEATTTTWADVIARTGSFAPGTTVTVEYDIVITNKTTKSLYVNLANTATCGTWTTAPSASASLFSTRATDGDYVEESDNSSASTGSSDAGGTIDPADPDQVTVTWKNGYNDTPVDTASIDKGTRPTEDQYPADPTRTGYHFAGWGEPEEDGEGNITITATWHQNHTWTDKTDSEGHQVWADGKAPTCTEDGVKIQECTCGATQEVEETGSKLGHIFEGAPWVDDNTDGAHNPECTSSLHYHDCTRCGHREFENHFTNPEEGWTQTKAPNATEPGEETRECPNCDHVEKRDIAPLGQKRVIWVDENGTDVLDGPKYFTKGTDEPAYAGKTPTKDADDNYTYKFNDWTKSENGDNITYTATYTRTEKPDYAVTWKNGDETIDSGETKDPAKIPAIDPAKIPEAPAGKEFDGWEEPAVDEENKTITIQIKWKDKDQLTVKWVKDNGEEVDSKTFFKGDPEPEQTCENPSKPSDASYNYTFKEWIKTTDEAGNITYTATYTRTAKSSGGGNRPVNPPVNPPEEDLDDPDVPLAELPTLNQDDHFAYIIGKPGGTIQPLANITRAEVVTIFFRIMTDEARQENWGEVSGLSDVAQGVWYNHAVCVAVNAGLIKGLPDGTFAGNQNITRAEFATIAARFLDQATQPEEQFTDIQGHWAEADINRASVAGWIKGVGDGKFNPDAPITRAEVMTLVNRMLNRKFDETNTLADMIVWPDNVDKDAWYYGDVQEATNDHEYDRKAGTLTETWTKITQPRDWSELEK